MSKASKLAGNKRNLPTVAAALFCTNCGSEDTKVIDSRGSNLGGKSSIRRRRECNCGQRYTTYELRSEDLIKLTALASRLKELCGIIMAQLGESK